MPADKCSTSRVRAFGKPIRVRVSDIQSDPRFTRRQVDHTLAEDIFRQGLQNYIIVRKMPSGPMVVAGEKRLAALRFLSEQVPKDFTYTWVYQLVLSVDDEDASYLHQLSNCLLRQGMTETDRLRLQTFYESLSTTYMYRRWRTEEPWHFIAAMTGVSRATLLRFKTLQSNVVREVRTLVDDGTVSMRTASDVVSKWSKESQIAFAERIKSEGLTGQREIQALAREFTPEPTVSVNKLTRDLKTIERALKKGEVTVDYRTAHKIFDSAEKILAMSTESFNASRRKGAKEPKED